MSIADFREREGRDALHKEALRQRPVFLIAGAFFGAALIAALLFKEEIDAFSGNDFEYFYPLLLFLLIGLALFMVACYRMPALGARLIGFEAVLGQDDNAGPKTMSYTKSFEADSATAAKRQATRRMSVRQARRKYARKTAEMDAAKSGEDGQS